MNNESLQAMQLVPDELLAERIESVKVLQDDELDFYEVCKDRGTGEHYLHYAYVHRDMAAGGEAELYHHLMPISNDDVLSYLFGEARYEYPEQWQNRFLRNGPAGSYVWYDPSAIDEDAKIEEQAEAFRALLRRYKSGGEYDAGSTSKLLEDVDRIYDKDKDTK